MRETEHTIGYTGNVSNRGAIRGSRELTHVSYGPKETSTETREEKDRTNAQFGAKFARRNGIELDDESWKDQGSCAGTGNEKFFPEKGASTFEVRNLCAECVVYEECATEGILKFQEHGVWGGLIESDRDPIIPDLRQGLPWKAVITAVREARKDNFMVYRQENDDPEAKPFKRHYAEQVEAFESERKEKTA